MTERLLEKGNSSDKADALITCNTLACSVYHTTMWTAIWIVVAIPSLIVLSFLVVPCGIWLHVQFRRDWCNERQASIRDYALHTAIWPTEETSEEEDN